MQYNAPMLKNTSIFKLLFSMISAWILVKENWQRLTFVNT